MPHNNMPHNTDYSVNSGWFLCVKNNTGGGGVCQTHVIQMAPAAANTVPGSRPWAHHAGYVVESLDQFITMNHQTVSIH